ncbi:MAG: hypothetical protein R2712_17445 [Vicinamibacterales bacterium]
MQKLFTLAAAGALLVGTMACGGKSDAEKQMDQATADMKNAATEMQKAAENAAKAGEGATQDAAKGMQDFAKAMAGMAGAMGGDGKTVEPVTFQSLQTMLPELSGWEMAKPRGERMTAPVPFAQTEARYTKGDARLDVKVVDSGFATMLIAPWSMMLASGYSRESTEGYEKAVTVNGQPAFEKWNSERKSGELNVLVDRRFLVSIEGRNLDDMSVLHDAADGIDFGKFASLK